ncbi:hypothetical protein C1H46_026403 [Malus baccata]|uniref:Neprosin PEP catalytic domain-containing protein n=1 Tax=Malus baccata TaxID=106549 RepID=A0A540LNH4_MALBA|nr:hypothetical protein C1H46_026403 [Malus baccata]
MEIRPGALISSPRGLYKLTGQLVRKTSLGPVSKFGGDTYDVGLSIYHSQDPVSENWWLQIGAKSNITVGYWPKEIVPSLLNGAEDAEWGGIAMTKENEDSPPMGGGQFPDGFYDHAAYFKEVRYMLKVLEQVIPTYCDSFTNMQIEHVVMPYKTIKIHGSRVGVIDSSLEDLVVIVELRMNVQTSFYGRK